MWERIVVYVKDYSCLCKEYKSVCMSTMVYMQDYYSVCKTKYEFCPRRSLKCLRCAACVYVELKVDILTLNSNETPTSLTCVSVCLHTAKYKHGLFHSTLVTSLPNDLKWNSTDVPLYVNCQTRRRESDWPQLFCQHKSGPTLMLEEKCGGALPVCVRVTMIKYLNALVNHYVD